MDASAVCLALVLGASGLFALSGLASPRLGRVLAVAAALAGLAGVIGAWVAGVSPALDRAWPIPVGRFSVGIDALSGAFLLPVLVVPALGTVYASAYVPDGHPTARRTRFSYGLLAAAMVFVLLARDAFVLLVAWEVMALAAFFAVTADDHDAAVRESGWVYLVATHLGTLCLIAGFAVLSTHGGSLALAPTAGLSPGVLAACALLFLVGFGMKAGIMPLHVWLPGAHANAPSHVSAVMSGVVLGMGVYGLMRSAWVLVDLPTSAGTALLVLGAVGAVLGAVLAAVQQDLKRLLAYSSVDNMGIVAMALGLGLIGRALGRDDLLALGIAGAVLHVCNHALFKPLLFFSAGAVVHATGTRSIDRLGGLARSMPGTAGPTIVGAAALAGLPPLNGFVSELLVYVGLIRAARDPGWPALAAPALAMTGAFAVVAMVKLYGMAFLGTPRQPGHPHDPPRAMAWPMYLLAGGCFAAALGAAALAPALDGVVAAFACRPVGSIGGLVPLATVTTVLAGLILAVAACGLWYRRRVARAPVALGGTWGCGYIAPTPRLQYTGTSFSEIAAGWFERVLRPVRRVPAFERVLPPPTEFAEVVPDPVLDRAARRAFRLAGRAVPWVRRTQRGSIHAYILYILVAIIALLLVP